MNSWTTRVRAPRPPRLWHFVTATLSVPLIMALLGFWQASEYRVADATRSKARASFERRIELISTLSEVREAETNQRGYVITGNPTFLAAYDQSHGKVTAALVDLDTRFADLAEQRAMLDQLRTTLDAKFVEMNGVIAVRRASGLAPAAAIVSNGSGRALMDRASATADAMIREEEAVGASGVIEVTERLRRGGDVFWGLLAAGAAFLATGLIMLWRQRRANYKIELLAYEAAERQHTIFESTIDAILILNPSGTIETLNAAATSMLGYARPDLMRRDISTVMDVADGTGNFHQRIGLVGGQLRQSLLIDRTARHLDGRLIPVDVSLGVMDLPDGQHIVASLRDISERKRMERVKDDLMSTVSHELRTPLTSIIGSLGLLRAEAAGKLPTDARRLVEIAENNSRRLIRLINDMLDIDSIESGKLRIDRTRIDLRDVLKRACEGSEGLARTAEVKIACHVPDEPMIVTGDGDRLLQVISNLASNAIRVSPPGSTLRIGLSLADSDKAMMTVDDEGPGVPIAFRDRIFGRFERADRQDGAIGTGLGLAISREIVVRHGGTIWFEDRPGGGTRFAFTIDLSPGLAEALVGGIGRLLICEDDPDVAEILRKLVAAEGYSSDWAATAAEARAAVRRDGYDAVLLDLHLPDENGFSLARTLREEDPTRRLPIIVVSALAPGSTDEAIPIDIIDWIEKPVDPSRLSAAIAVAMARTDSERPTILHLDDDRDMLAVTASALKNDARILQATDLASARVILQTETPDLAILDLHLADGYGLDLLPALVDRSGVAIPAIVYSAQEASAEAASRVDAVLVKSRGSLPDLKATIRRVVDKRMGARGG